MTLSPAFPFPAIFLQLVQIRTNSFNYKKQNAQMRRL